MRSSLTQERLNHYKDILEKTEFEILVSIGFDLEFELPYKHLRQFCEKYVPFAVRENLH